jgi:hypothetical protein
MNRKKNKLHFRYIKFLVFFFKKMSAKISNRLHTHYLHHFFFSHVGPVHFGAHRPGGPVHFGAHRPGGPVHFGAHRPGGSGALRCPSARGSGALRCPSTRGSGALRCPSARGPVHFGAHRPGGPVHFGAHRLGSPVQFILPIDSGVRCTSLCPSTRESGALHCAHGQ